HLRHVHLRNLLLLIAQGEDQIPTGALHLRDDVDGAAAEVCVRLFESLALDAYLPTVEINRAVAHERLREGDALVRRVERIERREARVGRLACVVEEVRIVAAVSAELLGQRESVVWVGW